MFILTFCAFFVVSEMEVDSVIIKGVRSMIWIGYCITLPRESRIDIMDATVLREIRDLIPFHVFLILFQFLPKYLL